MWRLYFARSFLRAYIFLSNLSAKYKSCTNNKSNSYNQRVSCNVSATTFTLITINCISTSRCISNCYRFRTDVSYSICCSNSNLILTFFQCNCITIVDCCNCLSVYFNYNCFCIFSLNCKGVFSRSNSLFLGRKNNFRCCCIQCNFYT